MSRDDIEDLFDGLTYPGSKTPLKHHQRPVPPPPEPPKPKEWDDRPLKRTVLVRGKPVDREFFTIQSLAMALGRSQVTIRAWIDKRWLPDATYRSKPSKGIRGDAGRRLWTRAQIEAIVRIADEEGLLGHNLANSELSKSRFTERIWEYLRSDPERK